MTDDMTLDELAAIQRRHDNSLRSPTVPGDLETAQRTERILRDDRAKLLALLTAIQNETFCLRRDIREMQNNLRRSDERAEAAESQLSRLKELAEAVDEWCGNCEGSPDDPNDAELMKAVWTYNGDVTEPCPECDGDCGEPCAPCTVADAHGSLDRFIADYNKRNGVSTPDSAGKAESARAMDELVRESEALGLYDEAAPAVSSTSVEMKEG